MVRLKTMDEVEFVVDSEIAFQSELIKGMNTDCPDENQDMPIPLPIVHSRILTKVIEFCEYHRPDRTPLMRPKDPPPVPNNTLILVSSDRLTWTVATVDEANARKVAGTINYVAYKKDITNESGGMPPPLWGGTFPAERYWIEHIDQLAKQELKEKEAEKAEKEAAAGIEGDKVEAPVVEDTEKKEEAEPEMQRMTLAEEGVADKAWDAKFIEVDQDTLFSLVLVANYLYIPALLELGLSTIGAAIKGKPPKEVRTMYGIPDNIDPSRPPGPSNKSKSRSRGKKNKADGSDDSMDVDDDDEEDSEGEEEKPVELPPQRGTRSRPVRTTRKAVNYSFEGEDVD